MESAALVDSLVLAITHLGSGPGVVSLALLYTWWVDPAGGRKLAILLGISWLLNLSLKELFALPRPFDSDGGAALGLASEAARATARGPGFPSGHAQATAIFWFFLAGRHRNRWLLGVAVGMVVLVSLSRIWLGVHFTLDVFGGLALGSGLAWLGLKAPEPLRMPAWSAPLWLLAGLPAVWLGRDFAEAAGFAVGIWLTPGDHRLPQTRSRRLLVAAGGLAVLWGLYLLARPAIARLPALPVVGGEVAPEVWGGYLRAAALTVVAFGLWPRWVLGRRPADAL